MDVRLTDRKFSLLSRRSQDWCTHPGSWGPKRQLFQSGELPAISLPVRWTRSPSCSKPRQSLAVFLWLLSNKPGGEGRKRKGRKQTWLVEKYILEHPGVANFFSLVRTLLPLRLKRLVSVFCIHRPIVRYLFRLKIGIPISWQAFFAIAVANAKLSIN